MSSELKFMLNARRSSSAATEEAAVLHVDLGTNQVQMFSSHENFRAWAERSKYAGSIARADALVEQARKYQGADSAEAMKRQIARTKRITKELEELADATGLAINSEELFLRATTQSHPLEGPVFHSAILFENTNLGGRALPLASWTAYPDLSRLGFNDIASSVRSDRRLDLYEHSYFNGRRLSFAAPSPGRIGRANLSDFGFNDIASSVIAS